MGAVVAVGCDKPTDVELVQTFDGYEVTGIVPKSGVQCIVAGDLGRAVPGRDPLTPSPAGPGPSPAGSADRASGAGPADGHGTGGVGVGVGVGAGAG